MIEFELLPWLDGYAEALNQYFADETDAYVIGEYMRLMELRDWLRMLGCV
jgi:hypothetical protein